MFFRKLALGFRRGLKGCTKAFLRAVYPPFCAHCHIQLDKDQLLCSACFSQLELKYNRVGAGEPSVFLRTPVSLSMIKQVGSLQGARLVKGIAGYVALQLTDLGYLNSGFYVQKGFEDLGRAVEKLTKKPFLGTFRSKRSNLSKGNFIVADPEHIDLKMHMLAKSKGLRCIYLVGRNSEL